MASTFTQLAKYGHQLDGTLNRYKSVLYAQRYMEYRRWLKRQNTSIPLDKPLVVFDFRDARIDGPQGRRFYCLFVFFVRAGFYPVLRENYFFLGNIQEKYKKLCLQEDFAVLHNDYTLPGNYVLVTDKWHSSLSAAAQQIVSLNYHADYSATDSCFPMPFPMFPPIYSHQQDLQLAQYRQQPRLWNIFFGGDANPEKYNKDSIRDIYKKLGRAHILELLRQHNSPHYEVRELQNTTEFTLALVQHIQGMVVMDTRHCNVDPADWLGTLANSHFFLACPGVRYPMSHNIIEAMAVGTIPVTQYPEMFFPALEHGKNCLVFNDANDLLQVIETAASMSETQRAKMRLAVQNYYENFLSPARCISRLLAHHPRKVSLRLLPFLKDGGGFA